MIGYSLPIGQRSSLAGQRPDLCKRFSFKRIPVVHCMRNYQLGARRRVPGQGKMAICLRKKTLARANRAGKYIERDYGVMIYLPPELFTPLNQPYQHR